MDVSACCQAPSIRPCLQSGATADRILRLTIGIAISVAIAIGGFLSLIDPGPDSDGITDSDPENTLPENPLRTGRAFQGRVGKGRGPVATESRNAPLPPSCGDSMG